VRAVKTRILFCSFLWVGTINAFCGCGGSAADSPVSPPPADAGADSDAQSQPADAQESESDDLEGSLPESAASDAHDDAVWPDAVTADALADSPSDAADCMTVFAQQMTPVIDGLLYMSESDYPFELVSYPDTASGPITPQHMLELLNLPASTVVEQRTFDEFFTAYLLNGSDGSRYQQMRTILESELTDTTVIRVGEVQVHIYLVGRNKCSQVAGLTTISIET
jgi:hypothetical protein